MAESQNDIYYACGDNEQKIALLPQVEAVKAKGYEVLYFTDEVDEFAVQMLMEYDGKHFVNVCKDDLDLSTDAEKEAMTKKNEDAKGLLDKMKEALDGKVTAVKLLQTNSVHTLFAFQQKAMFRLKWKRCLILCPALIKVLRLSLCLRLMQTIQLLKSLRV